MRWTREQYLDLMTFKPVERPMFTELFGLLVGLEDEWRAQGASEQEISLDAFDWDVVAVVRCGGSTGPRLSPPVVIEETSEQLIQRDGLGRTLKLIKKTATIPLPLDFPVKSMQDWLRLKPLFGFDEHRIDWAQVDRARAAQAAGAVVVASIPGAFDTARELMGEEVACLAYYDQPELMRDIIDTLRDTSLRVLERIVETLTIDQLSVHEDFAGRSGPLVGPQQIRDYFRPYYRAVWDLVRSKGGRVFQQDTDGNINAVIGELLDCGLTSIYPMEPAAGMDIVELRRRWGDRLAMRGGIDKHVLRRDKAAIRRELEAKVLAMRGASGLILALDHRIPNGTPLENYRYYVDLGREMLGMPPRSAAGGQWSRMAF